MKTIMEIKNIPLCEVTSSPANPRKTFDPEGLRELADNIREQGLLQPITVRPIEQSGWSRIQDLLEDIKYEIVYGERRFRALKILNGEHKDGSFASIPAFVRNMTDEEAFDAMITENLQRKDVDPTEEAFAFQQLTKNGSTPEEIAARFGKSERFVRDRIKLNDLIPDLAKRLREGSMAIVAALMMSNFDAEVQQEFLLYANTLEKITKKAAEGWVQSRFCRISTSAWYRPKDPAEKNFEGSCGCKCSDCPLNTANEGCLFHEYDIAIEDGQCSDRKRFAQKHYDYLLHWLKMDGAEFVKTGEPLAKGKTVLFNDSYAWSDPIKNLHNEIIAKLKAEGYEVAERDSFTTPIWAGEDDPDLETKLNNGEAYRCIPIFGGRDLPNPKVMYYRLHRDESSDPNAVPPEVKRLVDKYNYNIQEARNEVTRNHADMALKMGYSERKAQLTDAEQEAFDVLLLSGAGESFLRHKYNLTNAQCYSYLAIAEVASEYSEDRQLWMREFIRNKIYSGSTRPGCLTADLANCLLPEWIGDEYAEMACKVRESLDKKNGKLKKSLEELGYDVWGNKLGECSTVSESDDYEAKKLEIYNRFKAKHPDALHLFRVGERYEAYQDDAAQCALILKGSGDGKRDKSEDFVLYSFPHKKLEEYLPKLIRAGVRVAIIEEDKQ